jgi:hypothetical protein
LGLANYKLHKNTVAFTNFKHSLSFNRSSLDDLKETYLYMSILSATLNSDQQDFYLTKYDSISTLKNSMKTEELLVKYETIEKEKEIEVLKTKKAEDDLIIQKANNRIIIIVSVLIVLLLIIILLILRNRSKQNRLNHKIEIEKHTVLQTKLELSQKERELSLKIDALKNQIGIVEGLKKQIKDTSKDEVYTETIVNALEQKYISDKHWDNIIHQFNSLHKNHIPDLKNKNKTISRNDIKLSILIKLDYTNTSMAEVLNISIEGVKKAKQRLKKKMS